MDSGFPPGVPRQFAAAGRIPLAVVVVDRAGLVSHWSTGARRLFGHSKEEAVGAHAADLMPVAGALTDEEHGIAHGTAEADTDPAGRRTPSGYPTAGRATIHPRGGGRTDVLWWAYPLVGPGPGRHLVLAADSGRFVPEGGRDTAYGTRITPAFALHTEFPDAAGLARRLPHILPNMSPAEATRITSQILELGYPVLEFSRNRQVPVTPDRGAPRRRTGQGGTADGTPREGPGGSRRGPAPRAEDDLEYASVRERLEFLNEVSGRVGSSLDLERTIREVTGAAVPRFADFAGTHLRAAVIEGEGFPDGTPDVTTVWHRVWGEHNDAPGRWDDTVPVGEALAFPDRTPFFECMVTGEPVLIPTVDEEAADRISGEFEEARPAAAHQPPLAADRAAQGARRRARVHGADAPPRP